MKENPRLLALQGLISVVVDGRSLSAVTPTLSILAANDRALATELLLGTLHHYFELKAIAKGLLTKQLKQQDHDVLLCLLLGLYQLHYTRIPDHAALHETVSLCEELDKPWAKSILNAILRRVQRSADLINDFNLTPPSRHNLPNWLYDQLTSDWADSERWLVNLHERAPLTLRVNRNLTTTADYLELLSDSGISATAVEHTKHAIRLNEATDVRQLPHYEDGFFSVQDAAAQWAGHILDPHVGERILDACAAPGGKSAHILELTNNECHLVALDNVAERLDRLRDNLKRLSLNADVRCGDAMQPDQWLAGSNETFDRILCDAPCSATGIIRRHPDITIHRTAKDIKRLNQTQWRILKSLWPLLKPGGTFLYSTCSILKSENEQVIADFLRQNKDARLVPFNTAQIPAECDGTWQIFPGDNGMDGFFYAKIVKQLD